MHNEHVDRQHRRLFTDTIRSQFAKRCRIDLESIWNRSGIDLEPIWNRSGIDPESLEFRDSSADSGPIRLMEKEIVHPRGSKKNTRNQARNLIFGGSGASWGCLFAIFLRNP